MKRIMIVTSSLTGGGAERSMNLLANELLRRGWVVSLVPINSSQPDLIEPQCEVFPINRKWSSGFFDIIHSIVKFNRIVIAWKPEIVILNCALPELFGSMMLHCPSIIVLEHAKYPWVGRESLGKFVRRVLQLRGAKWVAVSSHLKIWALNVLPDRVLQNSISRLEPQDSKIDNFYSLKRIVFIGRLSIEKRPDWVLEISSKTGIPAIFIGDGSLRAELESKLNNSKSSVNFQGYVRNPWSWIIPGDLLIVPSEWEGDGLVIIEALQSNIPILLSDIPEFRRFHFPDHNYAPDCEAFVHSIQVNADDLNTLRIPVEITSQILLARTPVSVGGNWHEFLQGFVKENVN